MLDVLTIAAGALIAAVQPQADAPRWPAPLWPVQAEARPSSGAAAATPAPEARTLQGVTAEPQVPTGKFTTTVEVKPILTATKANWVAVRDWDGQDLVYVTHLWAWRCGLAAMHVSINGAPSEAWPLPECHEDTSQPNAMLEADGLPYRRFPPGSVETIVVELTYDDLSTDSATFERAAVLMP